MFPSRLLLCNEDTNIVGELDSQRDCGRDSRVRNSAERTEPDAGEAEEGAAAAEDRRLAEGFRGEGDDDAGVRVQRRLLQHSRTADEPRTLAEGDQLERVLVRWAALESQGGNSINS